MTLIPISSHPLHESKQKVGLLLLHRHQSDDTFCPTWEKSPPEISKLIMPNVYYGVLNLGGQGGQGYHPYFSLFETRARICKPFKEPKNRFTAWRAATTTLFSYQAARDGILEQSMGARNRVGIGLSYRPARLHRLAGSIPSNRFLGSIKV
jgi:hypothetical protein